MINKEKLKTAIEQDINPKDYYNEVIRKIEKGKKLKNINNMWKWALVPICLVVVISGVLFLNYQNNNKTILKNNPYVDKENNVTLNINEITNHNNGTPKLDADIKTVAENFINIPLPYKSEINLPKDLDKEYNYIVYTRENKESTDFNILNNYIKGYTNGNERNINIAYSKDYKPMRDYYFSDESCRITTINGINLKIYKYENAYYTEFNYNGYNFDIETSKITEQELSTFLVSILK